MSEGDSIVAPRTSPLVGSGRRNFRIGQEDSPPFHCERKMFSTPVNRLAAVHTYPFDDRGELQDSGEGTDEEYR
jgi:hypothetical protein